MKIENELDLDWYAWVNDSTVIKHHNWYYRGKYGVGRLVVVGKDLRGMGPVRDLRGARFVGCDMREANLARAWLEEIELIGCDLSGVRLENPLLDRARIEDCQLTGCTITLVNLIGAQILAGCWSDIECEHCDWTGTLVVHVNFRRTAIVNPILNDALFRDCDFRGAELRRGKLDVDVGTAYGTRFERCDFRGASLKGLRLRDTEFVECAFDGLRGKPAIEGPYSIRDPDFSAAFDGSEIGPEDRIYDDWGEVED